jgi:hypothetical protein
MSEYYCTMLYYAFKAALSGTLDSIEASFNDDQLVCILHLAVPGTMHGRLDIMTLCCMIGATVHV